jgi:hypothetical protein
MEGHDVPEAVQQAAVPAGPVPGQSAAGPTAGPTLPRLLGNQAFASFARAGRRGPAPVAGTRPPAESGDDRVLARQLARAVQLRQPSSGRTLARDPKKGTPERQREAERLKAQMPKLEQVGTAAGGARDDLKAFATEGIATVDRIAGFFGVAASLYKTAYESHRAIVEKDEQAAADAKESRDAVLGIVIGVASAYTCVPLLEALAIRKLLVEAGGELAELIASKAKEAAEGEPAAKPPSSITPDAMELEQSKELIKLYRDLAVLQAGEDVSAITGACDKVVIEIERYHDDRNRFPAAKLDAFIAALVKKEPVAKSTKDAVAKAKADLDAKLRDVEKRMAINDPQEILKDIWTRWLAAGNEPGYAGAAELERLGIMKMYGFLQPISQEGGGPAQAAAARALRGKTGTAATDLAPVGEVLVDGAAWPASTRYGDRIPAGTAIRVTGLQGMPPGNPWGGPPSEPERYATLIVDWEELPEAAPGAERPGEQSTSEEPEPVSR